MLVYPLIAAIGVAQYTRGAAAVSGYAIVFVFAACYFPAGAAAVRQRWTPYWLIIGLMIALFVAALPFAHENAFFLAAVFVSLMAMTHRRLAFVLLVVTVLASLLVPWAVRPWHTGVGWVQAITIVFTVLTVYAFAQLARSNLALVEARADVARLASEAERARIARDLHDLLGHSLTAITVKSGLARRLVLAGSTVDTTTGAASSPATGAATGAAAGAATGAAQALQEITEVEQLSRQALREVRAAIAGYREVTLAGELARGRELLRAAGVTADLPTAVEQVDGARQELFGWVVREGLTNVARHARAAQCTVTLTATSVEIRDNGIGQPNHVRSTSAETQENDAGGDAGSRATLAAAGSRSSMVGDGTGLNGLRERIAAAGGRLEAGPLTPHGWRLRATLGGRG
jgi:two-component system sensor histidine kinase DesK